MKTITLDFSTYEDELNQRYLDGKSEVTTQIEKMLKVFYETTLSDLTKKYEQYETSQAERAMMNYVYKGGSLG